MLTVKANPKLVDKYFHFRFDSIENGNLEVLKLVYLRFFLTIKKSEPATFLYQILICAIRKTSTEKRFIRLQVNMVKTDLFRKILREDYILRSLLTNVYFCFVCGLFR